MTRTRSVLHLKDQPYTIWIEAECWPPEEWNYEDGNTDIQVTFAGEEQWGATFFTYTNIRTLTERYRHPGECLSGRYFWATDMILVDSISRASIEVTIRALLDSGEFTSAFTRCEESNETTLDWSDGDPISERFIENARREGRIVERSLNDSSISS